MLWVDQSWFPTTTPWPCFLTRADLPRPRATPPPPCIPRLPTTTPTTTTRPRQRTRTPTSSCTQGCRSLTLQVMEPRPLLPQPGHTNPGQPASPPPVGQRTTGRSPHTYRLPTSLQRPGLPVKEVWPPRPRPPTHLLVDRRAGKDRPPPQTSSATSPWPVSTMLGLSRLHPTNIRQIIHIHNQCFPYIRNIQEKSCYILIVKSLFSNHIFFIFRAVEYNFVPFFLRLTLREL